MTVERWRHLPIVKEVIEYTGNNAREIIAWANGKAYTEELGALVIRTPQGDLKPALGDYVVRGIEGELYPVPRSIFLGSYQREGDS